MQEILTGYFDNTMEAFLSQQKRIQDNVSSLIDSTNPLNRDMLNPVTYFQNVAQKNLDAWKNSWQNLSSSNDKSK